MVMCTELLSTWLVLQTSGAVAVFQGVCAGSTPVKPSNCALLVSVKLPFWLSALILHALFFLFLLMACFVECFC